MSEKRLRHKKARELSEKELRETEGGDGVFVEEVSIVRPRGGTEAIWDFSKKAGGLKYNETAKG